MALKAEVLSLEHECWAATVRILGKVVEQRDAYTSAHQQRVSRLAVSIAREMHFSNGDTEEIRIAALMHDLGKIFLPSDFLSKTGDLTPLEFDMLKTHAQLGRDTLNGISFPWPIAEIVFQHHERLDGSGYLRRLKGPQILLAARIVAVADVIDAITMHRPYRAASSPKEALDVIGKGRGTLFDADAVDAYVKPTEPSCLPTAM